MMKLVAVLFVAFVVIEGRRLVRRNANEEPGWCAENPDYCRDDRFKGFCPLTCAPDKGDDDKSDPSCCSSFTHLCHIGDFRKICPSTCKEPTCCSSFKHLCHIDALKKKCFTTCSSQVNQVNKIRDA